MSLMNWWDDVENASANLEAVLEFMDEFDSREQDKRRVETKPTATPVESNRARKRRASTVSSPPTRVPPPKVKVVAANPRKEEMRTLQAQAASLEIELQQLKESLAPPQLPTNAAMPLAQQHQQMMLGMWKEMALRQRKQRRMSEMENERLKRLLEKKAKLVENLQHLFERQPRIEDVSMPVPERMPISQQADSAAVFRHLETFLPLLYQQIDTVFTDPRLETLETSFRDVQTTVPSTSPQGDPTVEALEARILPFEVNVAAQAMWDFACHGLGRRSPHVWSREIVVSGDLIRKEIHGCIGGLGSNNAELHGRSVMKRIEIGENRVAIVSSSLAEPTSLYGQPITGVMARMMDWIVIEKPRNPNIHHTAAQIQLRRVASFLAVGNDAVARRNACALMDFFAKRPGGMMQMVENVLFEAGKINQPSMDMVCAMST